jgi:hypothetical protein
MVHDFTMSQWWQLRRDLPLMVDCDAEERHTLGLRPLSGRVLALLAATRFILWYWLVYSRCVVRGHNWEDDEDEFDGRRMISQTCASCGQGRGGFFA